MKRLMVPTDEGRDWWEREDVPRIVKACAGAGYVISDHNAREAWLLYSDSMAAGWLCLPEDDDALVSIIKAYTVEED